jgi:hypothetical protein
MLQADVTLAEMSDGYSVSGQLASVHFLSGIIFELNDEPDEALISYRRAYKIMKVRNEFIPEALQISLLNLTKRRDFPDEYEAYVAEFGREHSLPSADEGEWILLYFDGVVSNKSELRFPMFDAGSGLMVTVVIPEYAGSGNWGHNITFESGDRSMRGAVLENIERRAREDLNSEMPAILAAATARVVAKTVAIKSANDQDAFAGAIALILALASEQADLRSWNMLPANIQVVRLVGSLTESAQISEKGTTLPEFSEITGNRYVVVFATSLSKQIMTYPVYEKVESVAVVGNQYDYVEVVPPSDSTAVAGETDVSE